MPDGSPLPVLRPQALVVNFNAPELNALALTLAREGELSAFVRPYVNKGRVWERTLARLPVLGRLYASTFGRRRLDDPCLNPLTIEAGVGADLMAAACVRLLARSRTLRHTVTEACYERIRLAVAAKAAQAVASANCVVGYQGFALPAFTAAARHRPPTRRILNYSIAHHREHRRMRDEELEREPAFASSWPGFEHWPRGYEAQLDAEIAMADGILVASGYVRDSFVKAGVAASKLHVIPYGVDLELFAPPPAPAAHGRFEVVFAGQLTQRKGLSYLLRAYQQVRHAQSRLTLVGLLLDDAAWLAPLSAGVRHVPHLPRADLAELYRQSSVFVFPTLLEGMGLVVLEAMACGLPVIVTDHGPGELVRDGVDGFVIPIRDEQALAFCLNRLDRDRELCRWMGQNAARRAREFSWESYAQRVRAVLNSAATPQSASAH